MVSRDLYDYVRMPMDKPPCDLDSGTIDECKRARLLD